MNKLKKKPQDLNETNERKTSWNFIERIKRIREGRRERIIKTAKSSSNEEAWNSFSPEQQQEMSQSLELQHDLDLDSLDLSQKIEFEPSIEWWEELTIKSELELKDSIWKYIMVKWHKCRKFQPGITWFAYSIIQKDRYDRRENYIKIWFFDKWVAQKYVTIGESWKPNDQQSLDNEEEKQTIVQSLESENDIVLDASKLWKIVEEMMHKVPHKWWEQREFKKWVEQEDSDWKYIIIDGHKCRKYQSGITWFAYSIINDKYRVHDKLELWFYEKWELIKWKDWKIKYITL